MMITTKQPNNKTHTYIQHTHTHQRTMKKSFNQKNTAVVHREREGGGRWYHHIYVFSTISQSIVFLFSWPSSSFFHFKQGSPKLKTEQKQKKTRDPKHITTTTTTTTAENITCVQQYYHQTYSLLFDRIASSTPKKMMMIILHTRFSIYHHHWIQCFVWWWWWWW